MRVPRLKLLRLALDMTQAEVAAKAGVTQQLLSYAENDRFKFAPEQLTRLADTLEWRGSTDRLQELVVIATIPEEETTP